MRSVSYTHLDVYKRQGTDAPAVGYAALASDGADGVNASTKGNNYLVLNVNTSAKTVSFML